MKTSTPGLLLLLHAVLLSAPAKAEISFEKTFLSVAHDEASTGIDFPLLGLSDSVDATLVSARVYRWTQTDKNGYELTPANEFSVFPQVLRIAPGTRRSVRIKATQPLKPGAKEEYYRIVLEEHSQNRLGAIPGAGQVAVKPKVTIPLVVHCGCQEPPDPESRLLAASSMTGKPQSITVKNVSTLAVRVGELTYEKSDGKRDKKTLHEYLLPQHEVAISVPNDAVKGSDIVLGYVTLVDAVAGAAPRVRHETVRWIGMP